MRKFLAGCAGVLMLSVAVLAWSLTIAGPAEGRAVCARDRDGRPVYCRCIPNGEPIDPRFWEQVARMPTTAGPGR